MNHNNVTLDNSEDIVNAFATYFQSGYITSSMPDFDKLAPNRDSSYCGAPTFSESEVLKSLKKLKPKLSAGPDGLPSVLLKDCATVLAKPLCFLFNLSLRLERFPDGWKSGRICPIFKKGSKSSVENYRPITIICNPSKVFETLLYDTIFYHVKPYICNEQHGFYPGRSTVTNLMCLTQYVATQLDNGGQVDVMYMDFSKAFDRLDHGMLLTKLYNIGLTVSFVRFLTSYLSQRRLVVEYLGVQSVNIDASSGVPQGSVLGPLLFSIFINDIVSSINCNALLYADDLKLYLSVSDINDCLALQSDLDRVNKWCKENCLYLNFSKCTSLSFTRKYTPVIFNYSIENNFISRCSTFKDLGVIFDEKLSFVQHINRVQCEALRSLGFVLRNSRQFSETTTVSLLFNAFVLSKLEYASVIWDPGYQVHINSIEKIQRRYVKYLWYQLDGLYPLQGTSEDILLQRFQLNNLATRRLCNSLVTLRKIITGQIDCPDLLNSLRFHVPHIATRLNLLFYFPTPKTNLLKFSPLYKMVGYHGQMQNLVDIFHDTIPTIKGKILTA